MAGDKLSGAEFKKHLRAGEPKMGLFLNAHSPTVAAMFAQQMRMTDGVLLQQETQIEQRR